MSEVREKRDLVLAPGTYAYMQDVTKGVIKTYTGPTVINPTAQEVPVIYDAKQGLFRKAANLEDAVSKSPIAVEGFYLILLNPARKGEHPQDGSAQPSAELEVGRKVNIPGPVSFALWPGQAAQHVRGHHLHSNQYLLVRVYNEEEARKNWGKAVVKPATDAGPTTVEIAPEDLTVGRLLIIRGTEVSFYIPPTGISVVQDGIQDGKPKYVRDALTLERLEYCILVDEDGNKRYEQGPKVVFPEPTERFVEASASDGKGRSIKFRAIELNEIQGLHVKVIAPYTEGGKAYKAGDELFITGKDTAIYYPREEHSAIKYDGKAKHFATAIPAGEARYVLNRMTGAIRTVKGPAMLLPDPRVEVIVRRVLSDKQCSLWYPGNAEALSYNQGLRTILQTSPTTRSGAISEGDIERGARRRGVAPAVGAVAAAMFATNAVMESSQVSGDQGIVGDEFSRASSYSQPRTVTLDTKYQGVPSVDVWTGYAVQVVSKTGKRRIEQGPTSVMLEYDESLEILELSTGKPKTTDNLFKTAYLRVENNKVADVINAETLDHVQVQIKLSYLVNFDRELRDKWFDVENYVKFLCDHIRSVLKGVLKKVRVQDFYANSVEILRDAILGPAVKAEGSNDRGIRTGMFFAENGMRIVDVEVLQVAIGDEKIRQLLDGAQHSVVSTNIELSAAERQLEVTRRKEAIARELAETAAETAKRKGELDVELAASQLAVVMAKLGNALEETKTKQQVESEAQKIKDVAFDAELARQKRGGEQETSLRQAKQLQEIERLRAESEAITARFTSAQQGFSEALLALSNNETLQKVAQAWSIQRAIGGENVSDALSRIFAGTPLAGVVARLSPPTNGKGVTVTAAGTADGPTA